MKKIRSLGTHNTLDGRAPGTAFADVICFTESIPDKLMRELIKTHLVFTCRFQHDLVIAVRKTLPVRNVKMHYRLVHPGIARVTPHRGVFWITFDLLDVKHAVVCEHRINAAFPPYKRGEAHFRRAMWRRHTRIAKKIIARLMRNERKVLAGGDLNTPRGISGYQGLLKEVGGGLDRLGSHGYGLKNVRHMSTMGSDHHRVRASAD